MSALQSYRTEIYLQEADDSANHRVTTQTSRVHLVHRSLRQECFHSENELSRTGYDFEVLVDDLPRRDTVRLIQ